jgi:hypothetical protein
MVIFLSKTARRLVLAKKSEKSVGALFFLKSKITNFVAIICHCQSVALRGLLTCYMIDF